MKIMEMAIDDIVVLKSYRQDMGDIPALAANIEKIGLLQAIGITPGNHLIFGSRRIAAHRHLGRTTISARIIEIDDIIRGTWSENEMRKAFTRSERVAILATMERKHPGQPKKNCQNSDNTFSGESRDQYTIRAGLGNHTTAYEAKKVIEDAIP